ncbi:lysozyme inhibitor LprI family protein [Arenimonas oryziterrae]
MSICVRNRTNDATSELSKVEGEIRRSIDQSGSKELARQFQASSEAFQSYLHSQCLYQETLASPGNGASDIRRACEAALVSNRTQQLVASRSWLNK